MGYTHYWYRSKIIPAETFEKIVSDFRVLMPQFEGYDVPLAGGDGTGEPVVTPEEVVFNGKAACGHPENHDLVIPWPEPDAGGVRAVEDAIDGQWFGGTTVVTRTCNGNCSYEGFYFPRVYRPESWETPDKYGRYFNFCKTAFRPYDLAVTAFLVIAKHHLGDQIVVATDGDNAHWRDAQVLCQMELGYGGEYMIKNGKLRPKEESEEGAIEVHEIVEIEDLPQFAGARVIKAVLSYCPRVPAWTEDEIRGLLRGAGLIVPSAARLIPSDDLEREPSFAEDAYFSVLVIKR